MTNPTSNFGWQMPTPTDLVTDLPADFEVFGQAVDTSMADLKGGTTGQILSKTTNTDMDFTWITNDVGDITAVNVTAPITGGGSSGAVTIGVSAASTSASGVVQLSDSTSTTSSVLASTPTATKSAYDLAAAAVPKSTVTTNGDVIYATGSAAVTRLGIGSTGQVLTVAAGVPSWATPSTPTNTFYAGKNKIINGDFFVNQRALTSTTSAGYGFDRWAQASSTGTSTYSAQTFTPGTAPVTGYEGATFARIVTATQSGVGAYSLLKQPIESVRTLAAQTATVSFWAKAATGTPKIAVEFAQNFGSGGSPSAEVDTYAGQVTLSTSWTRYSVSVTVPSISGKTIGTTANTSDLTLALWVSAGTNFNARTGSIGVQNNTFDIWGVQVEAGSTATDFQTASGSIGGELALCQRYYFRIGGLSNYMILGSGTAESTTKVDIQVAAPVTMRALPTAVDFSTIGVQPFPTGTITAVTAAVLGTVKGVAPLDVELAVASGLTQGTWYRATTNNSTSGYLGISAEL
jgi:hypothetical protein